MEQTKFYLDEHIHSAVAAGLRRRGVNVLTVQEVGDLIGGLRLLADVLTPAEMLDHVEYV